MIAVVEDEPELQALYRLMLASKGYRIAFVSADADDAVHQYLSCEKKPDLVIMDRRLKSSSGDDAACRIAAMDPEARILFATADASQEFAASLPGVVGVLQKPFPMIALLTAIDKALMRDETGSYRRRQATSLA